MYPLVCLSLCLAFLRIFSLFSIFQAPRKVGIWSHPACLAALSVMWLMVCQKNPHWLQILGRGYLNYLLWLEFAVSGKETKDKGILSVCLHCLHNCWQCRCKSQKCTVIGSITWKRLYLNVSISFNTYLEGSKSVELYTFVVTGTFCRILLCFCLCSLKEFCGHAAENERIVSLPPKFGWRNQISLLQPSGHLWSSHPLP